MIYKSLRQVAETVHLPSELGQQDSELQKLVARTIEISRVSTFRNSSGNLSKKYTNPFRNQ